jgi:PD-(D/E)XK nuclease superfamily
MNISARRKIFDWNPSQSSYYPYSSSIESITTNVGRFYKIPTSGEWVPSITMVVNHFEKSGIEDWKKRVGEDEAMKVSARARYRGTVLHEMLEKYLSNKDNEVIQENTNFFDRQTYNTILPALDNINNIYLQEKPIWDPYVGIAGRPDLIAKWKGELAVIDFKTSLRPKERKYITKYFEQAAGYSLMARCLNVGANLTRALPRINKLVIIIVNDETPEPQIFEAQYLEFYESMLAKVDKFKNEIDIKKCVQSFIS